MSKHRPSPSVSVVILNWNGGEMVCEAVTSVFNSSLQPDDVIVVDNASTDGSDAMLEHRFPRVKLIRNAANLGFAAGNNVGIRHALGRDADYILLLNNDATLDVSALQLMVSAMLADPRRGVIVPKIYFQSSGTERRLWAAGAEWRPFPPRVKMRGYDQLDEGQYDDAGTVEYTTGCALLIRRETFVTAGLLDTSYFMYQEDYAFCDQVRAAGFELWYDPRAVVYHTVSASTGESSPQKWRYWSQGVALFYTQHYGSIRRAAIPLALFLTWVGVRELAKGRLHWVRPFCQGIRDSLVGSPQAVNGTRR